jgi:hypothetical protein
MDSLFRTTTDPMSGRTRFARASDPETSHANVNPSEQDRATRLVLELMADGIARIDHEISAAIPNATASRLRHGRDAAVQMGYLIWTGRRRPTGVGNGTSREWVATRKLLAGGTQ